MGIYALSLYVMAGAASSEACRHHGRHYQYCSEAPIRLRLYAPRIKGQPRRLRKYERPLSYGAVHHAPISRLCVMACHYES